jgi:hypothetical protein
MNPLHEFAKYAIAKLRLRFIVVILESVSVASLRDESCAKK